MIAAALGAAISGLIRGVAFGRIQSVDALTSPYGAVWAASIATAFVVFATGGRVTSPAARALREMPLGVPGLLGGQLSVRVHRAGELRQARHRHALSSRSASSRRSACLPRNIRMAAWLRVRPSWLAMSCSWPWPKICDSMSGEIPWF